MCFLVLTAQNQSLFVWGSSSTPSSEHRPQGVGFSLVVRSAQAVESSPVQSEEVVQRTRQLSEEEVFTLRASARKRAEWARASLRRKAGQEGVEDEVPLPKPASWDSDQRKKEATRERTRLFQRLEAKRAKQLEEAMQLTSQRKQQAQRRRQKQERAATEAERKRVQRMLEVRGETLPTLSEARSLTVLQLRDLLWKAGFPAKGVPAPSEARELKPDQLKLRLSQVKARFLEMIGPILEDPPAEDAK